MIILVSEVVIGLLTMTDVLTNCRLVIFKVKVSCITSVVSIKAIFASGGFS